MRHTKKIAALLMAVVMILALVPTFASAETAKSADTYLDKADISDDYKDAIDMLFELDIMRGSDSGNFFPQANLKRSELTKMLFVVANRGVNNATPYVNVSGVPFTDYNNTHWACGYINWAYVQKIISGTSAAKFSPNNDVKGFEALKMMLGIAGYSQDVQSYTGDNWTMNVLRDATAANLLVGLEDIDLSKAITREVAAQMMHNLIFVDMVKYTTGYNNVQLENYNPNQTVGQYYLGLEVLTGVITANEWAAINNNDLADEGKISLEYCKFDGEDANDQDNVGITAPLNFMGREVKIYVKIAKNKIDKIYGKPVLTNKDDVKTMVLDDIAVSGTSLTTDDGKKVSGNFTSSTNKILYFNYVRATSIAAPSDCPVTVVYDKNTIRWVLVEDYTFVKISVDSKGKITGKNYESGDNTAFKDIDKDDIIGGADLAVKDALVMVRKYGDDVWQLVDVETITGTCTRGGPNADNVTVSGKTYKLSNITGAKKTLAFAYENLGKEQDFYVFNGKLLGATLPGDDAETTYCVVNGYEYNAKTTMKDASAEVKILSSDGSEKSYTLKGCEIKNADGSAYAIDSAAKAKALTLEMFSYTVSGTEIELKRLANVKVQTGSTWASQGNVDTANFVKGATRLTAKDSAANEEIFTVTSSTVFFANGVKDAITDTATWYRYVGYSKVPADITGDAILGMVADDRNSSTTRRPITAIAVNTQDAAFETASSIDEVVVLAFDAYSGVEDGKVYHYYPVFDGATYTVYKAEKVDGNGATATGGNVPAEAKAGSIITIDEKSSSLLTKFSVTQPSAATGDILSTSISGVYRGYITDSDDAGMIRLANMPTSDMGPSREFKYDNDTDFFMITALDETDDHSVPEDNEAVSFTKTGLENTDSGAEKEKFNVVVVVSKGVITNLYFNDAGLWAY